MIVDTSVLVAIILDETHRSRLLDVLEQALDSVLSSVSLVEAGIVLRARIGPNGITSLSSLVNDLAIEVVPFDDLQAKAALAAFERFGKGMGHKAQLNFGDCAVYALARIRREPVLATGKEFAATDLTTQPF